MGRTRPVSNPWLTITDGSWTWKVLQAPVTNPDKPFASWLCAVSSPYTFGGYDMGDTYINDIIGLGGELVPTPAELEKW